MWFVKIFKWSCSYVYDPLWWGAAYYWTPRSCRLEPSKVEGFLAKHGNAVRRGIVRGLKTVDKEDTFFRDVQSLFDADPERACSIMLESDLSTWSAETEEKEEEEGAGGAGGGAATATAAADAAKTETDIKDDTVLFNAHFLQALYLAAYVSQRWKECQNDFAVIYAKRQLKKEKNDKKRKELQDSIAQMQENSGCLQRVQDIAMEKLMETCVTVRDLGDVTQGLLAEGRLGNKLVNTPTRVYVNVACGVPQRHKDMVWDRLVDLATVTPRRKWVEWVSNAESRAMHKLVVWFKPRALALAGQAVGMKPGHLVRGLAARTTAADLEHERDLLKRTRNETRAVLQEKKKSAYKPAPGVDKKKKRAAKKRREKRLKQQRLKPHRIVGKELLYGHAVHSLCFKSADVILQPVHVACEAQLLSLKHKVKVGDISAEEAQEIVAAVRRNKTQMDAAVAKYVKERHIELPVRVKRRRKKRKDGEESKGEEFIVKKKAKREIVKTMDRKLYQSLKYFETEAKSESTAIYGDPKPVSKTAREMAAKRVEASVAKAPRRAKWSTRSSRLPDMLNVAEKDMPHVLIYALILASEAKSSRNSVFALLSRLPHMAESLDVFEKRAFYNQVRAAAAQPSRAVTTLTRRAEQLRAKHPCRAHALDIKIAEAVRLDRDERQKRDAFFAGFVRSLKGELPERHVFPVDGVGFADGEVQLRIDDAARLLDNRPYTIRFAEEVPKEHVRRMLDSPKVAVACNIERNEDAIELEVYCILVNGIPVHIDNLPFSINVFRLFQRDTRFGSYVDEMAKRATLDTKPKVIDLPMSKESAFEVWKKRTPVQRIANMRTAMYGSEAFLKREAQNARYLYANMMAAKKTPKEAKLLAHGMGVCPTLNGVNLHLLEPETVMEYAQTAMERAVKDIPLAMERKFKIAMAQLSCLPKSKALDQNSIAGFCQKEPTPLKVGQKKVNKVYGVRGGKHVSRHKHEIHERLFSCLEHSMADPAAKERATRALITVTQARATYNGMVQERHNTLYRKDLVTAQKAAINAAGMVLSEQMEWGNLSHLLHTLQPKYDTGIFANLMKNKLPCICFTPGSSAARLDADTAGLYAALINSLNMDKNAHSAQSVGFRDRRVLATVQFNQLPVLLAARRDFADIGRAQGKLKALDEDMKAVRECIKNPVSLATVLQGRFPTRASLHHELTMLRHKRNILQMTVEVLTYVMENALQERNPQFDTAFFQTVGYPERCLADYEALCIADELDDFFPRYTAIESSTKKRRRTPWLAVHLGNYAYGTTCWTSVSDVQTRFGPLVVEPAIRTEYEREVCALKQLRKQKRRQQRRNARYRKRQARVKAERLASIAEQERKLHARNQEESKGTEDEPLSLASQEAQQRALRRGFGI